MASPNWPSISSVPVRRVPEKSVFWNIPMGQVKGKGDKEYTVLQTFFGAYVLVDKGDQRNRLAVLAEDIAKAFADTREEVEEHDELVEYGDVVSLNFESRLQVAWTARGRAFEHRWREFDDMPNYDYGWKRAPDRDKAGGD